MRLLLTAKLLIDTGASAQPAPEVLEHLDGAARIALAAFLRPYFDGGVSLSTRSTVDPRDGAGADEHEFPLSERARLLAANQYAASLEQARALATEPVHPHDGRGGASVLITATLPIDTDEPEVVADGLRPVDDAIRLMFYRSLLPLLDGGASQTTCVTLDPGDDDAVAEFGRRGWGARVSRLSVSAPHH